VIKRRRQRQRRRGRRARRAERTVDDHHRTQIHRRFGFHGRPGLPATHYTGSSAHTCTVEQDKHSTITIGGNVTVTGGQAVRLNGVTVNGNVTLTGGGSEMIPWSIKNNTMGGDLTISGQTTDWLGVLFNRIGRNATLTNIAVTDQHPGAPGVFTVRNTVGRNLTCTGLTPGVSGGFAPGSVNVVGHNATGQCAALV